MQTMNDMVMKNEERRMKNAKGNAFVCQWRAGGQCRKFFILRSSFFILPRSSFFIIPLLFLLASCSYPRPDLTGKYLSQQAIDSLQCLYQHHYTSGTNLQATTDSILLECLPVKGSYELLRRGDRVVVAEVAIHPADSIDSVWVKLAHSQDTQGWLRETEMMRKFVPVDSVSQAIHLFSHTHAQYFLIVLAAFTAVWLFRLALRKKTPLVFLDDIDSLYPMLLCLLMAFCATLYESMQMFAPDTWQHFYFNPTLSPLHVPPVLAFFLAGLWLFIVVLLAAIDDSFRQLSFTTAVVYLLGLAACCIFCYVLFMFTTRIYIGYLLLAGMSWLFARRAWQSLSTPHYRCGRCGCKLLRKGVCPRCGAVNE